MRHLTALLVLSALTYGHPPTTSFQEFVESCMQDSQCIKYFSGEKKLSGMPILGVVECLQDKKCASEQFTTTTNEPQTEVGQLVAMQVFGPMMACLLNPACEIKVEEPTTSTTTLKPKPRPISQDSCVSYMESDPFRSYILCGRRLRSCIPDVCQAEGMVLCGPPGTRRVYLGHRQRKRRHSRKRINSSKRVRAADSCCSKKGCNWVDLKRFCCQL